MTNSILILLASLLFSPSVPGQTESDIRSRQIRPYSFQDGRLIFSSDVKNDPTVARFKIVWDKVR